MLILTLTVQYLPRIVELGQEIAEHFRQPQQNPEKEPVNPNQLTATGRPVRR